MPHITRRKLLGKGTQAVLAGGVALSGVPSRAERAPAKLAFQGVDYYQKLGVTPLINAAGTYTVLSASTMPDEVRAAIALAAQKPVNLTELLDASGAYLAKQLKCEAALITSGAAAALVVGTAACVSMGNDKAILDIPTEMAGLKNEVIVQKSHRYGYDHALRNCGIRFVEVETLEDYEKAFNERTVMAHFFNDAAADVPPISNLWKYTEMGFDLVTFSGGKGLRGPQCSGLLLGKKDLIDAAKKNNSPNSNTVGRGLKVAKEEIVGLVAAVDWFLKQDDAAMEAEYRQRADLIAKELSSIPTVQTQIFVPEVANHVPHLLITYDQNRLKITGVEVMQKMRQGNPRIELNPSTGGSPASAGLPGGPNTIVVGVWMLQPGEERIVAKCLRETLQAAHN